MDEPPPRPVRIVHRLLTVAVALSLLPGCAWSKQNRLAKKDPPGVRDEEAPGAIKVGDRSPPAKVALDGSAADDRSPALPRDSRPADNVSTADDDLKMPGVDPVAQKSAIALAGAELSEDEQPRGVTPATALSTDADRDARPSDRSATKRAPRPSSEEAITNLPGEFDVVGDGVKVKQGIVAATVNGHPIFVEDVLRDLPFDFEKAEKSMPPDQYKEFLRQLIDKHLQRPIEEELLLQALKTRLKEEQLKQITTQIDAIFNKDYLPTAMKQAGFETEAEFDRALRQKGSSIEMLRTKNRNRELAQQYIGAKVMPKSGFDRPDLLKYYNEHKEDYAIAAQAKWEQIHLKYAKNGGPDATRKLADQIVERLENGEDFAAIAKACSNGPNAASKGGARGWTTRGALKDEAIDEALFEQPLNAIVPPIVGDEGIDIIRIVDRTDAGYYQFAAVQEDIKVHLKNVEWAKASKALFEDLKAKATIVTFTDRL
ncbi:MAG: peptidylprolyl isomerase [Planctomycetia bacterium]|nr:peptidylprolyl isomerase [Planctomycetia bacterium]